MHDAGNMIGLLGFGEAGRAFTVAGGWAARVKVYDRLTADPAMRQSKQAEFAVAGVAGQDAAEQAVSGASLVLSLVTADQAFAAAQVAAGSIHANTLYLDFNSVAPETKRAAARMIEAGGGRYVDVAVMSPVIPARLSVPLLLSGAVADEAARALSILGFTNVRVVGDVVGRASSIKMIRSVMIKGLEALSAECMLAAQAANVLDEVLASLDASEGRAVWAGRADYNLDRMMVHGLRRAAEMEAVVRTLDALGTGSAMSRATVERQGAIGRLGIKVPPVGLHDKIAALTTPRANAA